MLLILLLLRIILFCLQITCKVKAKFTNNPLHPWSDTIAIQQPFFAGINVRKNLIACLHHLNPRAFEKVQLRFIVIIIFDMFDHTRREWKKSRNCFVYGLIDFALASCRYDAKRDYNIASEIRHFQPNNLLTSSTCCFIFWTHPCDALKPLKIRSVNFQWVWRI